MDPIEKSVRVKVDWYTRACLTAIAVLLTVLIVGLWAESPRLAGTARAAGELFGDASAERRATTKAIETTNDKLDELIRLLKSGETKMQVVDADGKAAPGEKNAPAEKP